MNRRRAAVARGPFHGTPVFVANARGAVIEDVDGNQLLDFASGIAVTNLGHCPDDIVKATHAQVDRFLHTSFNVVPYEGYVELAERLNRLTPGRFAKKTFLANSGAEAVENAVKIARVATGRQGVVVFEHGFHGRTFMAMTMTSKLGYRQGFSPFCGEVYRTPFPYAYRCPEADASAWAMRQFRELVMHHVGPKNIAAVVIELVLGEGGFVDAPPEFVKELAAFCAEHGILLVGRAFRGQYAAAGREDHPAGGTSADSRLARSARLAGSLRGAIRTAKSRRWRHVPQPPARGASGPLGGTSSRHRRGMCRSC
jgi:4-aminobutyrate aminotransferase/(S)-3-amino-2-methylpropionate transaminase